MPALANIELFGSLYDLPKAVLKQRAMHVYFDAASRAAAWALRVTLATELNGQIVMGRSHAAGGPASDGELQLAFEASRFAPVVAWLALNHGALDVWVHPNTGAALRDHRDCALWLGRSYALNLAALDG